jgi:hypothetical protein
MTETPHPATEVLAEGEIVHVPPAAAELAESIEHNGESGFIAEVPDWDAEDPLP